MKTEFLAAALAATLLPSVSHAGPFDGKNPAEVAAFIVFGYQEEGSFDRGHDGTVTFQKLSDNPFNITLQPAVYSMYVGTPENCTFDVGFTVDGSISPTRQSHTTTYKFDFSKLTGARVSSGGEGIQFEGATLQCVKSDVVGCVNANKQVANGFWQARFGLVDEAHKADAENYRQERVNQAIAYFRENICKPKG